jgi:hypothetical protein
MTDSENGKQIAEDRAERAGSEGPGERSAQQPAPNVVGLDAYRERGRRGGAKAQPSVAGGAWERTSQPLLPEDAESGRPAVHIVKVSSGFGKLRVPAPAPAWNGHIRCLAAA